MRKKLLLLVAFTILGCSDQPMNKEMPTRFQSVAIDQAQLLQEGEDKISCPKCGMNLPMFYKTNHAATVDGKVHQFCSIHCLSTTIKEGKKVDNIQVVDNETLKFIDAKTAWYVVGSSKAGTMSKVSKYGFTDKTKAETFAKEFGGEVMNFDATLKLAEQE
jgi:nitrous oxide reductase accessory protein NosL